MRNVNLVKIGSDSVNDQNLSKLIRDIKKYEKQTGESFVIISSGAVKMGKKELKKRGKDFRGFSESSLAAIGQQFLMQTYDRLSGENRLVGQVLIDDYVNKNYMYKILEQVGNLVKINFTITKIALRILRPC